MYSGKHVHTAWLFISLQVLYGPHGEGLQGLVGFSVKKNKVL